MPYKPSFSKSMCKYPIKLYGWVCFEICKSVFHLTVGKNVDVDIGNWNGFGGYYLHHGYQHIGRSSKFPANFQQN